MERNFKLKKCNWITSLQTVQQDCDDSLMSRTNCRVEERADVSGELGDLRAGALGELRANAEARVQLGPLTHGVPHLN